MDYQRAKQAGRILETLETDIAAAAKLKPKKRVRDWRPEVDQIGGMTQQLGQAESKVQSQAFSLLKASAKLAQAAIHDPGNMDELYTLGRSVYKALKRLETAIDRAASLED